MADRSNLDQLTSLLLFIGGAGVGGIILWFWGFDLIDKFLNRKKNDDA